MLKKIATFPFLVICQKNKPRIDNVPQIKSDFSIFQKDFLFKNQARKTNNGTKLILKVSNDSKPTPCLI